MLRRLAEDPAIRARAKGQVARLWATCGIPDFQKLGVEPHARFVSRVFNYLSEGYLPHQWFADEVARLDRVDGDVETIAGRVAAIRTWAYIAQRGDWLADPAHWQARTMAVEERLSDALHTSLTQRFVDKRTSALMKQIGAGAGALPVEIGAEGEVTIDTHEIGRLEGFRFVVAPEARAADKRLLLATAEKRLGKERAARGSALTQAENDAFALSDGGVVTWQGHVVARLARGRSLGRPVMALDESLDCLDPPLRRAAGERVQRWVDDAVAAQLPVIARLAAMARDPAATPALRSVAGAIEAGGGIAQRLPVRGAVEALTPPDRHALRKAGVTIGALDLFDARLLKARTRPWRAALLAAAGQKVPAEPREGATVLPRGAAGAVLAAGYRPLGAQAVRIDLVERVARAAHDARPKKGGGRAPFLPDPALATSIGLEPGTIARLMTELGFRPLPEGRWAWRGRPPAKPVAPRPDNAFAALAELGLG